MSCSWSKRHIEPPQPGLFGMTPVGSGLFLGLMNVILISLGLGITEGGAATMNLAVFVFMFGVVPGVGLGALLGAVAQAIRAWRPWLRIVTLAVPAVLLVAMLASTFGLIEYALVASIPTLVAALILERSTRFRGDPPVPVARVESSVRVTR